MKVENYLAVLRAPNLSSPKLAKMLGLSRSRINQLRSEIRDVNQWIVKLRLERWYWLPRRARRWLAKNYQEDPQKMLKALLNGEGRERYLLGKGTTEYLRQILEDAVSNSEQGEATK